MAVVEHGAFCFSVLTASLGGSSHSRQRLFGEHCVHIDFDQHVGGVEPGDLDDRTGRAPAASERLATLSGSHARQITKHLY
jgi:hypothetical protein